MIKKINIFYDPSPFSICSCHSKLYEECTDALDNDMSTGINIFQINEEEVMELSFWGWGMRQLCRVHVFRQQIVGFYIFVSLQYVYIHCGYTPFRHRYLNNICVLFGVTEALLCCCIAVVVNLQNCRVPSSALIYLLYVQLYI